MRPNRVPYLLIPAVVMLAALPMVLGLSHQPDDGKTGVSEPVAGYVVGAIDGDAIRVQIAGRTERVSLAGIDAPDLTRAGRNNRPYAREAALFLDNLLRGEDVRLEFDGARRDRYGRISAHVFREPDGLHANAELVRQGYARATASEGEPHAVTLSAFEARAERIGKGVWGDASMRLADDDAAPSHSSEPDAPVTSLDAPPDEPTERDAAPETKPDPKPAASGRINLNTAAVDELMSLPGIGTVLAKRIVDERERNGPFRSMSEFKDRVSGIGDKRAEAIAGLVTF